MYKYIHLFHLIPKTRIAQYIINKNTTDLKMFNIGN